MILSALSLCFSLFHAAMYILLKLFISYLSWHQALNSTMNTKNNNKHVENVKWDIFIGATSYAKGSLCLLPVCS